MNNKNNKHTFVVLAYKESKYLEDCIKSVLSQTIKTNAVIATSTPNSYIEKLAKKYNLKIIINNEPKGIAYDFNFAVNCINSKLITIAHQDDIYDENYAEKIIEEYDKNENSSIIFSDYYEIRQDKKVYNNINLKIKRILLRPLLKKKNGSKLYFRRKVLKYGNSICCPAVTFVTKNTPKNVFICDFKCNVDWFAWEQISKINKSFIYIPDKLMGHRISEETTTTDIINNGIRTKEDYIMFKKFWPNIIAKILTKIYKMSEKSNSIDK